jgi:hypothetical protein
VDSRFRAVSDARKPVFRLGVFFLAMNDLILL